MFEQIPQLLQPYYLIFLAVHFIGFVIGLGAATVSDILFMKFVRDYDIDASEKAILDTLSRIVWVGVVIFVISGTLLFLTKPAELLTSAAFLSKMIIVFVIIVNGLNLHFNIAPKLEGIDFQNLSPGQDFKTKYKTILSGYISITSWYFALVLAVTKAFGLSLAWILGIYAVLLLLGLLVAYMITSIFHRLFC